MHAARRNRETQVAGLPRIRIVADFSRCAYRISVGREYNVFCLQNKIL